MPIVWINSADEYISMLGQMPLGLRFQLTRFAQYEHFYIGGVVFALAPADDAERPTNA